MTGERLTQKKFPCPLCEESLEIRVSKKDLPYLICETCGVQMFIRYEKGAKRLKKLVEKQEKRLFPWE